METFSALLAICAWNSPVPGEFPAQRPVTRSFEVFFDLRLNKRLSKQSSGWWFETLPRPLWRHGNENIQLTSWFIHLRDTLPDGTEPVSQPTLTYAPVMPQSHPTTDPVRFLTPVRFLARKTERSANRNFTSVLFSWSHQATGPVRLTRLYTYGLIE